MRYVFSDDKERPVHVWMAKDTEDLRKCMDEVAKMYPNTMKLLADA